MRTGVLIENPKSGQAVRLLVHPAENGGRSFKGEWFIAPGRGRDGVPEHLHTAAVERFTVTAGSGRYRLGGVERAIGEGETVEMPAGVPHVHPWSDGAELRYVQETIADPPDLDGLERALQVVETAFALAREGKVDAKGVPGPLQLAVLGHATMPATYLAGMPIPLQRVLLPPVATLGRALGYRVRYERHARSA